ncbi:MAG: CtsR family transcriptional regulator [Firmicutes bacterium]|nr:CtsR family transcriptional regulator [Bacillota bacterium]
MNSTADLIESHLLDLLHKSPDAAISIQRNDLAQRFDCVPSQINYVIATRFTLEKGFVVESKRGGGGYIRIKRMRREHINRIEQLLRAVGSAIAQREAEDIVWRLAEDDVLSAREADMVRAALNRETIALPLPQRDEVRARVLRAMLAAVFAHASA